MNRRFPVEQLVPDRMLRTFHPLASIVCALLLLDSHELHAQWLDWDIQTDTRLQLSSIAGSADLTQTAFPTRAKSA